jgi:hypothetical protein
MYLIQSKLREDVNKNDKIRQQGWHTISFFNDKNVAKEAKQAFKKKNEDFHYRLKKVNTNNMVLNRIP